MHCVSCPHHQIIEKLLIQYFYEGLLPIERSMIDATSGRPLEAKALTYHSQSSLFFLSVAPTQISYIISSYLYK